MPAPAKLLKMVGSMGWAALSTAYPGRIKRCVLRGGNELAIDMDVEGQHYSAILRRSGADRFTGTWSWRGGGTTESNAASATLYSSSEGKLLFGEWLEDGTRYQWWAELTTVTHFPDEAATEPKD